MKAKLHPKGKGYISNFLHPVLKRVVTKGLGTTDKNLADAICLDCEALFKLPELLQAPTREKLTGYERRAVEIVFGDDRAAELLGTTAEVIGLSEQEAKQVAHYVQSVDEDLESLKAIASQSPEITVDLDGFQKNALHELLKYVNPKKFRELQNRVQELEVELKVLRPRCRYLESENDRLRAQTNAEVTVSLETAVNTFLPVYQSKGSGVGELWPG